VEFFRRNLRRGIKTLYYSGLKYSCVYCAWRYRKFEPNGLRVEVLDRLDVVGGRFRKDSKCPICKSTDRERLLYFYFLKEIKLKADAGKISVLHIAPEKNLKKLMMRESNIKYFSGDKFEEGYENSYQCEYLDVTDMKFADSMFDFVLCNHVLEHVANYNVALGQIRRVLKVPHAKCLENTYEDPSHTTSELRELHYGQRDHVRLFGMDYQTILERAGFAVQKFSSVELSNGQVRKNSLNENEFLYQVTKPCAV
jgi:SAM-dependent methyltransferase